MDLDKPLQTRIEAFLIDNDLFGRSRSLELKLADTACSGPVISQKQYTLLRHSSRRQKVAHNLYPDSLEASCSSQVDFLKTRRRHRHSTHATETSGSNSIPYCEVRVLTKPRHTTASTTTSTSTRLHTLPACETADRHLTAAEQCETDAVLGLSNDDIRTVALVPVTIGQCDITSCLSSYCLSSNSGSTSCSDHCAPMSGSIDTPPAHAADTTTPIHAVKATLLTCAANITPPAHVIDSTIPAYAADTTTPAHAADSLLHNDIDEVCKLSACQGECSL